MTNHSTGLWGEERACEYLTAHGMTVIKRNYHSRYGEIDIIAADKGCTVFVEVKTRKNSMYGSASEYVTRKKQEKIILTAEEYIGSDSCVEMRFDVVEVYYYKSEGKLAVKNINHIENAFIAE